MRQIYRRNNILKNCDEIVNCTGRREFLVKSLLVAGGLVLTLKATASAGSTVVDDLVVPIGSDSPLSKVGGFQVVESAGGKIAILRTGESSFVAYSAKCTHKGGIIEYDAAKKEFVCPKHGSTFDTATGNAAHGPADNPLPSFKTKAGKDSVSVTIGS